MINAETITAAWTKGTNLAVTMQDETVITGEFQGVNAKGINLKVDGKVVTRSLKRITAVDAADDDHAYTTAELSVIFGTNSRALRVQLRKLGLGVGQGRTYQLSARDTERVRAALSA